MLFRLSPRSALDSAKPPREFGIDIAKGNLSSRHDIANLLSCLIASIPAGGVAKTRANLSVRPHVNACDSVLAHTNNSCTSVRVCSTTVSRLRCRLGRGSEGARIGRVTAWPPYLSPMGQRHPASYPAFSAPDRFI